MTSRSRTPTAPGSIRGAELADMPIFADLSDAALDMVAATAGEVDLAAGEQLFQQGDEADALYLVRSGRLIVEQDGVVINELGRGATLGELSLLTGMTRSASVRSRRDTRLLRLSRDQFTALTDEHPHLLRTVAATVAGLAQRIAPRSRPAPRSTVIAVLGLRQWAELELVERTLVAELRLTLRVEQPGRVDGVGLERAESAADRAVVCADARHEPETVPTGLPPRVDLLLVGPRPGPDALRAWHERVPQARIQLVGDRAGLPARVRSLARGIAGVAVGLALGGGGARAFSHIGVLGELERAGVQVDRVAGTSMGAWVGGCFAVGMDAAEIAEQARREYVLRNPYGDYTFPRVALSRGVRTRTALARCLGPSLLEELPREFAATSVDLYARVPVIHRTGPLVDVVRASLSLPVLYPPYELAGRLHVDGGLIDNLPVAALAEPREGPVLAVNVVTADDHRGPRPPSLGETLIRSIMLASTTSAAAAMLRADLAIAPDARGVGLLEFDRLPHMIEVGRRAARAALDGGLFAPGNPTSSELEE